ncbi:MAG: bacteriocin family protein [Chloroflexi bacterium]|nr:bacteriocin family protein [Chloroflexota bacterium]
MADFLHRDEAPLTQSEWDQLDKVVVDAASRVLVGRRFISVVGPFGPGLQEVPSYVFTSIAPAIVDVLGQDDPNPVRATQRLHPVIPMIYKDFWLFWRDVETSHRFSVPLSLTPAAAAAAYVAQKEDDLIFNGNEALGYEGLLTVDNRQELPRRDWAQMGAAFADTVAAMKLLVSQGFFGPYVMVTNPTDYASMARVYENTGVLEIEQVRKIMTAGIYQSPSIPDGITLVASIGPQNFDLVIAQDLTVAYLSTQNLNHPFRALESLVLRVHRPGSLCTMQPGVAAGGERRRK